MSLTIIKGTIVSAPALGRLDATPGGYLVAGDGIWDVKKLAEDWRTHFEGASMMVQFDDRRYVTDARRALQIMTKRILAW